MNIDVGQVIAGKYELVRLLGKGAMGEVWLATHNSLGGEFAIKLVEPADDIEAETAAGRFQLEAQIAAKLSRKTRHIVSVSDHGEEEGLAYLVMELLEGESLEARSKRIGPLPLPEVAAIVSQIARALGLAHEAGIFHRDLKPANVWLGRDEDGRLLVKLLDFGIARSVKPFRTRSPFATSKDMVLGTPSYMSPEQARGLATLDYRCDLWALAVVAYEALTRAIPFEGETVEDIFLSICTFRVVPALARRPDLPPAIEAFFARAFAPQLEERYVNADELAAAFEGLVSAEDLEAALGIPLSPTSVRRLEAARRSQPSFTSEVLSRPGDNPNPSSSPNLRRSNPDFGGPAPNVRRSNPDFGGGIPDPMLDEMSVALHGVPPQRRNAGLVVALVALVALLGIGIITLVAVRGDRPVPTAGGAAPAPPPPSVPATGVASTPPPPSDPPPVPSPPPSPPSAAAVTGRPAKSTPPAIVGPSAKPPQATAVTAAPAPAPSPPTSKPRGDKGDVF